MADYSDAYWRRDARPLPSPPTVISIGVEVCPTCKVVAPSPFPADGCGDLWHAQFTGRQVREALTTPDPSPHEALRARYDAFWQAVMGWAFSDEDDSMLGEILVTYRPGGLDGPTS